MVGQTLTIGFVLGAIALLFLVERFFPLRRPTRRLPPRLAVNSALSLLTYAVAATVVRPASLFAVNYAALNRIALLSWLPPGGWQRFLAEFALLDLSFYYWHRLNHVTPLFWRFHNVHHSDPDLDVSTGFRFHFGEVLLSTFFRVAQGIVIGPSRETLALFELVFQVETYFHHSNIRLPERMDRLLQWALVTPRMHGIHHSDFHQETDSNYSVICSLWDRLHRTYRAGIPPSEIVIGVPGYAEEKDNQIGHVLLAPFRGQHDYWRGRESRDI